LTPLAAAATKSSARPIHVATGERHAAVVIGAERPTSQDRYRDQQHEDADDVRGDQWQESDDPRRPPPRPL
jgi:hypothetical protein